MTENDTLTAAAIAANRNRERQLLAIWNVRTVWSRGYTKEAAEQAAVDAARGIRY
jgi:hypothetical protein